MTARVADLTFADAWGRMRRYRPLVLTVVVTLGALRIVPSGPEPRAAELAVAPAPAVVEPVTGASVPPTTAGRPAANPGPVRLPVASPGVTAPTSSRSTPSSPPPVLAPATRSEDPSPDPRLAPGAPPIVRYTGWATTEARTPLAALGVPEGALPVATRLGQLTKASFLRVEGDWELLVLDVDTTGTTAVPDITLRACAITDADWDPGSEQSFDDAPAWDDECVDGTVMDGRWGFPLASIDHPNGVAIVPGAEAPLDFQVSLRDPRPETLGS